MKTPQKAALFIDQTGARLVTGKDGFAEFSETLESGFESHPRYRGEGSNQARFGTDPYHGSNNEYHAHRKEEEIKNSYFHQVSHLLLPYDEVLLFGPGETKKELHNHLLEKAEFRNKVMTMLNSDHQTDKQLLAMAGDFLKF